MKIGIAGTAMAGLSLVLSLWFYLANTNSLQLRVDAYSAQQKLDALTPQATQKRQLLQSQQEKINTGSAIADKVGPAVVADITALAEKNSNTALKDLLTKHGLRGANSGK